MQTPSAELSSNQILARLHRDDLQLLQPDLEAVALPLRKCLETRDKRIQYAYFIEQGVASVTANGAGQKVIEVGLIGREGMTGLAIVMEDNRTPTDTYMQIAGNGQRISAAKLFEAANGSASIRRVLLQYGHAFLVQTMHTAMVNGRNKIEERLARWLLMAHDGVDDDDLPLTHEFLAMMLAVGRPGVTVALNHLEKGGLIQARRGVISVIDRAGLEQASNGAYGKPEAELRRLFG